MRLHFVLVQAAYKKATGNRWKNSHSAANRVEGVSAETIISAIEAVAQRTQAKINSFPLFGRVRTWRG